jgi:hypothetical protein
LIVKDIATGQLVEIENDLDDLELYGYEEAITNDDCVEL